MLEFVLFMKKKPPLFLLVLLREFGNVLDADKEGMLLVLI